MNTLTETTTEAPQALTVKVENNCRCMYCTECELGFQADDNGQECPECGEDGEWFGDCFGCGDDMRDDLDYLLGQWAERHEPADYYVIAGSNMGWRRRSGWLIVTADTSTDAGQMIDRVSVDSDFTQRWTLSADGELFVIQSHHDGVERYDIRPFEQGDIEALGLTDQVIEHRADENDADLPTWAEMLEEAAREWADPEMRVDGRFDDAIRNTMDDWAQ